MSIVDYRNCEYKEVTAKDKADEALWDNGTCRTCGNPAEEHKKITHDSYLCGDIAMQKYEEKQRKENPHVTMCNGVEFARYSTKEEAEEKLSWLKTATLHYKK